MDWKDGVIEITQLVAEAAAETLWPTRCALCDTPGKVLCEKCERELPYLDWWKACRRCGSPFGYVQCDLCCAEGLSRIGVDELPFAACASATLFAAETGQVVRVFKDQGEQRLGEVMAELMMRCLPPDWAFDSVTFVPATLSASRQRGFDHAQLIAAALARKVGVPCQSVLMRPKTRDQRGLSAKERIQNLAGSFAACELVNGGRRFLLIDDVMTTGATLCAASKALGVAGASEVRCLTFARA